MIGGRRVYGPTRSDPHEAHRDAIALRDGDAAAPQVTRTLGEAADAMHAELQDLRRAGTVDFYARQARAVFRFVSRDLALVRLTPAVLQEMIRLAQRGGFSARTIQHYRRWLHRLVVWASKPQRGWFRGPNPVPLATWPQPQPTSPDVIGEAELAAMLERVRAVPDDHEVVLLAAYSGLRRAELARLHATDFDFARNVVWVRGKVQHEAAPITAPIRDAARRLVERALARGDSGTPAGGFLVPGAGETRRVQWIDRLFRRWARRLGDRRFHPHALRHSLATNLVRAGVEAGVVQRMLRHSSFATTQRYVHLVAADLHAATGRLRYVSGGEVAGDLEHG
jgi:integrase/recombinase XerC